jgi:hypothetical protein
MSVSRNGMLAQFSIVARLEIDNRGMGGSRTTAVSSILLDTKCWAQNSTRMERRYVISLSCCGDCVMLVLQRLEMIRSRSRYSKISRFIFARGSCLLCRRSFACPRYRAPRRTYMRACQFELLRIRARFWERFVYG